MRTYSELYNECIPSFTHMHMICVYCKGQVMILTCVINGPVFLFFFKVNVRNAIHMSGNQAKNIHSELSIACRRKVGITCWRQVKKKMSVLFLKHAEAVIEINP